MVSKIRAKRKIALVIGRENQLKNLSHSQMMIKILTRVTIMLWLDKSSHNQKIKQIWIESRHRSAKYEITTPSSIALFIGIKEQMRLLQSWYVWWQNSSMKLLEPWPFNSKIAKKSTSKWLNSYNRYKVILQKDKVKIPPHYGRHATSFTSPSKLPKISK